MLYHSLTCFIPQVPALVGFHKKFQHRGAPKDVQEMLGHSDACTTMNIYAHSSCISFFPDT